MPPWLVSAQVGVGLVMVAAKGERDESSRCPAGRQRPESGHPAPGAAVPCGRVAPTT